MPKKANSRKLYIVGIDSTPLWILKALRKKYNLKGFDLIKIQEIESTIPPVTSAAWPTIYTGLPPNEHGIIEFSNITKNYEKELLYYNTEKNMPFWDVLATKGFKSLIITPAVALQKSKFNNVDMITGWPLPPRFSSSKMEKVCKDLKYDGEPEIGNALNTGKIPLNEATKIYTESIRRRAEVARRLMKENDYDLVFVCFTETDRIQHYSLSQKNWQEFVGPLYEEISDFITYLDKKARDANENYEIMVVSDHGAQKITHKFLISAWLSQNGYVTFKSDVYKRNITKNKGSISKLKKSIVDKIVENKYRQVIYNKMPNAIKKAGVNFVEDAYDYESEGKYIKIKESDFEMEKTKAFSVSIGPVGMIWINDERFAKPAVRKNEKAQLKNKLIKKLSSLKIKNEKLLNNVYDGTKHYSNKNNFIAPDIIFEMKENITSDFSGYLDDGFFTEPEINRSGDHTIMGIFGTKNYKTKSTLDLTDVYPIIMDYLGV